MKVVIVGAVAAGMSAAAKLRRASKEMQIVVFEKGDEVSLGACGLPFFVAGYEDNPDGMFARTAQEFRETGIDLREFSQVMRTDTTAKNVTVKNLKTGEIYAEEYDKLIVASGTQSRIFPPFDKKASNILAVKTLEETIKIKTALENGEREILIVGGGFVGVEMADACKAFKDVKITMVQRGDQILSPFDKEITEILESELADNNIKLFTDSSLLNLVIENQRAISAEIKLSNDEIIKIPTELVINATGTIASTDFITGVEKAPNGAIKVDQYMRTTVANVFAVGDCSIMKSFVSGEYTYCPLGTNANKQGRIVADYILGKQPQNLKLINSIAIKVFGVDAARVGLSEKEADSLGIQYKTNIIEAYSHASYWNKDKIMVKLIYRSDNKKIIGAQMVGKGEVAHRCNYFAIAISAGMTTDEFGVLDLSYAPPFSGVWDPTLIAGNTSK